MKKYLCTFLLIFIACMGLVHIALSEDYAENIAKQCIIKVAGSDVKKLTDGRYKSSLQAKRTPIYISSHDRDICAVYIKHRDEPRKLAVEVKQDGQWVEVARNEAKFLAELIEFVPNKEIRLRSKDKFNLQICELEVFAEKNYPPYVQKWEDTLSKCDILLAHAHPDDEQIFMGGVIPYYISKGKTVQTYDMVPSTYYRKLEYLDGLWHSGLKNYPIRGKFGDTYALNLQSMYKNLGVQRVRNAAISTILMCKPEVIVTHDLKGEYGHGAHRLCADVMKYAFDTLNSGEGYKDLKKQYGDFKPKKLYFHLYQENKIKLPFNDPLEYFDGKSAFQIAVESFDKHVSQRKTKYVVANTGKYSILDYGLYKSHVGEDINKNDFLENID